jgi:plasmid stabilization system protein ParE
MTRSGGWRTFPTLDAMRALFGSVTEKLKLLVIRFSTAGVEDGVLIVRVLHQRMDFERHL